MNNTFTTCMGYPLFNGSLTDISLQKKTVVNTINQYSYCMAEQDAEFKKALMESDMLLPDGIGMVFASRFLDSVRIQKIAGADLHQHLLHKLNQEKGSCFYLGSSNGTLQKIRNRIKNEYPNISVHSYSPPYKAMFNEQDSQLMIQEVNRFAPDVLFIGMTAPKQEKWIHHHKLHLNTKVIGSIGAVFDFYAGTVNRPAQMWISLGMEWFGRLLAEPKRMWKRYLYYGPLFTWHLLHRKVKTAR
ncbi:WecB/TagA/CpsF family glycosyltransferase [Mucilaginibacter sp. Bleaf8]|uniref:WecB/TagA/CpsF family glycosyltransferase n=1 Tax=Mucilaginibacter sp. Bleaf8 TaxID=2834430 RepID=UPI001BCE1DE5|nr:WecB/TagA/CpsF family glycosyltransferase [Mucilaginibacter sp. Bleaf8]MBS7566810.1 WecB/TagA/CpsF family glycosyltransferase [Mucilaginibacter sp. Bleaf8]